MLRILEEQSDADGKPLVLTMGIPALRHDASNLLKGVGALSEDGSGIFRISIRGYEYYQELKAPRGYWIKKNWFPVAVLVLSSVVTVVTSLIVVLLG